MRKIIAIILATVLWMPLVLTAGSKGSSSRSSSSTKSSTSTTKTVHVKQYERKDGTVVKAHDRSAPGTKAATTSKASTKTITSSAETKTSTKSSTGVQRDSHGKIKRSAAAKKSFMKETGYPKGRKGYVVDHIKPLECGGADDPSNMQWQTVAEGKIKDKTERSCRL